MYMNAFMLYRHSAEHKSHMKNSCASDIPYGGWLSILCSSAVLLDGTISLRCTRCLSPSLIRRPLQDTTCQESPLGRKGMMLLLPPSRDWGRGMLLLVNWIAVKELKLHCDNKET